MTAHVTRVRQLLVPVQRAFTQNLGLKALSFSIALGLVAYQRGAQEEQQRTLPVDVIVRMPPVEVHRELMTLVPPSLHVTLRGATRALDSLTKSGLPPIEIDLRRGELPRIQFDAKQLSLPPDVQVAVIDPESIELDWQAVVERSVSLRADLTGEVAPGHAVTNVQVEPASILVRGPESLVEVMQFVRLSAFDVSGKTEGIHSHRLALLPAPQRVAFGGTTSAVVHVTVARKVANRRFTDRPVTVLGLPKVTAEPARVDVLVTGPAEVVEDLREEMIVPRATLLPDPTGTPRDQRHGSAVGRVNVDLGRVEVEVQPPTVTVTW